MLKGNFYFEDTVCMHDEIGEFRSCLWLGPHDTGPLLATSMCIASVVSLHHQYFNFRCSGIGIATQWASSTPDTIHAAALCTPRLGGCG